MTVQVIQNNGKPEWAVVPYEDYLRLIEQAEMLQDVQDYDAVQAALKSGEEELISVEMVDALLSGGNPVKIWREYRGISQFELAQKAGISVPYLSQLETNKRRGSMGVLSAIAKALQIPLDDLASS
jgi:DNA-binding XRE family transcriptional regulator